MAKSLSSSFILEEFVLRDRFLIGGVDCSVDFILKSLSFTQTFICK